MLILALVCIIVLVLVDILAAESKTTLFVAMVLLLIMGLAGGSAYAQTIPRECLRYRNDLVRNAREIWGMDAPIATLAADMRQESGCRPGAHSKYADGLMEFTPATATWISRVFPDLVDNAPFNPVWAMRAQSHYLKLLVDRAGGDTACDDMWFALWAYNGGEGWVHRDRKLAQSHGADGGDHDQVEPFNAGRARPMFKENRDYPKAIILRWQPLFVEAGWGPGACL